MSYYRISDDIPLESMAPGIKRKILAYQNNLMLVKVFIDAGSVADMHSHPHQQVGYILEGKFEFDIGGDKHCLSAGDSFVVPPNVVHGATCLEKGIVIDSFSPMREDFLK